MWVFCELIAYQDIVIFNISKFCDEMDNFLLWNLSSKTKHVNGLVLFKIPTTKPLHRVMAHFCGLIGSRVIFNQNREFIYNKKCIFLGGFKVTL